MREISLNEEEKKGHEEIKPINYRVNSKSHRENSNVRQKSGDASISPLSPLLGQQPIYELVKKRVSQPVLNNQFSFNEALAIYRASNTAKSNESANRKVLRWYFTHKIKIKSQAEIQPQIGIK